MAKKFYVINSRGEREPFSIKKLYNSCRRIGASKKLAERISEDIQKESYPGIETSEIFKLVKHKLTGTSFGSGIKFSLKEAMRKLGPGGFDFEKYAGEVFARNGFDVRMNENVSGSCISSYEIDFLAVKRKTVFLGECKYHHQAGKRVDLKVGLCCYAKFLDILKGSYFEGVEIKPLIVTNSKFSSELKKYASCVGIELLGWRYPSRRGLEKMIEKQGLYPVTILPSFQRYLKKIFAQQRVMLAKEILETDPKELSKRLRVPIKEIEKLNKEAATLLE